jgi:hypothetical protein
LFEGAILLIKAIESMRYFSTFTIVAFTMLLLAWANISRAQDAIVLFDEAKKITGSLGHPIEKIAEVNGNRLYPGDTVNINKGEIEFKVLVNYPESTGPDEADILDEVYSIEELKISEMQYDKELIKVDHTVQPYRDKAFPENWEGDRVDYWKFLFIVKRPVAGNESWHQE